MKITNGTLTKDATPEQAKALAAAGWKPVEAPKATAPRNILSSAAAPGYGAKTPEEEARRFATEEPDNVGILETLFPLTRASARMRPGEMSFPWQMTKDLTSFPGRFAGSENREQMANPVGENFIQSVIRDPLAVPGAALGAMVAPVALPAASLGLVTGSKMADRLTDADPETGAMPAPGELTMDAALSMLPDVVGRPAGAMLRGAAAKIPAEASASFMRMMKFLPGQQKMALWKAGKEFADDPALRREVLRGAESVPDVTANFLAGKEARLRALDPVMSEIDATGKKVNLREAMDAARAAVLDMEAGTADPRTRAKALEWLRQKVLVPPKGSEAEYLREVTGVLPSGEVRTAMLEHPEGIPWNAVLEMIPSQARRVKSNLDRQIDWQDLTNSEAQGEAAQGAANYIRRTIEDIDPTQTIGSLNREAGRWIAPTLGFERAATRASNANRQGVLQQLRITNPRDTPASIRRLDLLEKVYGALADATPKATAAGRTVGMTSARNESQREDMVGMLPELLRELLPIQRPQADNTRTAR